MEISHLDFEKWIFFHGGGCVSFYVLSADVETVKFMNLSQNNEEESGIRLMKINIISYIAFVDFEKQINSKERYAVN